MFQYIGTKTKQRVSMSKKSKVCTGRGSCAHGGVYCFVCVTTGPVFDPASSQSQSNIASSWLPDHSKNQKNTDTDEKKNTEVSVYQYVFEIRSISISI